MKWPKSDEEKLRALWEEGIPTRKIAALFLGATRNSILGKVHRMGLSSRVNRMEGRPRTRKQIVVKAARYRERRAPIMLIPEHCPSTQESDWIPFMKSNSKTCRSIMGYSKEDGLALFCSNEKTPEDSFCPHHQKIYYNQDHRK